MLKINPANFIKNNKKRTWVKGTSPYVTCPVILILLMANTGLSYNFWGVFFFFFQFLNLPWAIKIAVAGIWGVYFKAGRDTKGENMDYKKEREIQI